MTKLSEFLGIREQVILTFFVFVTASLWIFQILASGAVNDVSTSGQDRLGELGDEAVDISDDSLTEIAFDQLDNKAIDLTHIIDMRVEKATHDLAMMADTISVMSNNSTLNMSVDMVQDLAPIYQVRNLESGVPTGLTAPIYRDVFVIDDNATLRAISSVEDKSADYWMDVSNEHYWEVARLPISLGLDPFIYDTLAYNETHSNRYWEPVEWDGIGTPKDMIILPHSDLAPFQPRIPSNLDQMQNPVCQHDVNCMVFPDDGNFNPEQIGFIMITRLNDGGYAGVTLTLAALTEESREYREFVFSQGRSGYAYIFNERGVLTDHVDDMHLGSDSSWHKWVLNMSQDLDGEGQLYYAWKGQYRFVSFQRSEISGWTVAVVSPSLDFTTPAQLLSANITETVNTTSDDMSAMQRSLSIGLTVVTVLAIIASVVTGVIMALHITRPIQKLTMLASRMGSGELEARDLEAKEFADLTETGKRDDEIAELMKSFHDMVGTLKEDLNKPSITKNIVIRDSVITHSDLS